MRADKGYIVAIRIPNKVVQSDLIMDSLSTFCDKYGYEESKATLKGMTSCQINVTRLGNEW